MTLLISLLFATSAFATASSTCGNALYPVAPDQPTAAALVRLARAALSPTIALIDQPTTLLERNTLGRDEWRRLAEIAFAKLAPQHAREAEFVFDAIIGEAGPLRLPPDQKPSFGPLRDRLGFRRARVTESRADVNETIRGLFDDRPDYDLLRFDIFREVLELRPFHKTFAAAMLVLFKDFERAQPEFPRDWRAWTLAVDGFVAREFGPAPPHVKRFIVHALETFFLRLPRVNEATLAREIQNRRVRPQAVAPKTSGPLPSVRIRAPETTGTATTIAPPAPTPAVPFADASRLELEDLEANVIYAVPLRADPRQHAFIELSPLVLEQLGNESHESFAAWLECVRAGPSVGSRRGVKFTSRRGFILHNPAFKQLIGIERREVEDPALGKISVMRWTHLERKLNR